MSSQNTPFDQNKIQNKINSIFSDLVNININDITEANITSLEKERNKTQNDLMEYKNLLMLYKDYIKHTYDLKYSTNIKNRYDNSVQHLVICNYQIKKEA